MSAKAIPRQSSDTQRDVSTLPLGSRRHNLIETSFRTFTDCGLCREWNEKNPSNKREQFIWGLAKQGFRCTECGFPVHRRCREEASRNHACSGVTIPKIIKFLSSEMKNYVQPPTVATVDTVAKPIIRERSRPALLRPITLYFSCLNLPQDMFFVSMYRIRVIVEYSDDLASPSVFDTEVIPSNNPIFSNTMAILRQDTAKVSFQVREKNKLIGVLQTNLSEILAAPAQTWKCQLSAPTTGYRLPQGIMVVKWDEPFVEKEAVELPQASELPASVFPPAPATPAIPSPSPESNSLQPDANYSPYCAEIMDSKEVLEAGDRKSVV